MVIQALKLALITWLGSQLFSPVARAELGDFKAGAGPVYGSTFSPREKDGAGFQTYLELGLSDCWSIVAGGGANFHEIAGGDPYRLYNFGLGISYNLDVLVVVPFVSMKAGWLYRANPDRAADSGLGFSVALGFDYLWTENFTVGLAAEYHGLLSDNIPTIPGYAAFTGRVGFRLPY
jgi:hypothetical protein